MIAAIYARKSTEQNGVVDEGKSVTRQIQHSRAYAERKGWTVDDRFVFVDDGISGAEFSNRPGFLRLMNALKPKAPFQVLVMSEESRLGREAIETAYALKQLVTTGVRVFFYLEDRERTLDSPTDKIMLSLTAFADELEREKARQRTHDAMLRKAQARHVTGGRVFGYDNVDIMAVAEADGTAKRQHVIRRVNEAEAAIVRRIFELCAQGFGKIRIAKTLNDEGARTPRAQRGRPNAWCASSVREVLHRDLYRGLIVWNKTQKRDAWGQKRTAQRPEEAWIRVPAPELRMVSDDLWTEAHRRLQQTRDSYLRQTNGRLWGKPTTGLDGKYLLTGLARCGMCGGALEVQTRSHGAKRAYYYGCRTHWRASRAICRNALQIPMDVADAAVLEAVEDELLDDDVIAEIIDGVIAELSASPDAIAKAHVRLQGELRTLDKEIGRLSTAIAKGGQLDALLEALAERERKRTLIHAELERLTLQAKLTSTERGELVEQARVQLKDWRAHLRQHVPQARQIISKLVKDRLSVTPEPRNGVNGFRVTGAGEYLKFCEEISTAPQAVASPTGTAKGCNLIFSGIAA